MVEKTIIKKLFEAKKLVASNKEKKVGKNTYSNYDYFTPEQVKKIVDEACFASGILTIFSIEQSSAFLSIICIETGEKLVISMPIEIPDIKATNSMQKIGSVVTYAERYLKMTAFGIADNSLDFDTTENTKKNAENNEVKIEWMDEKTYKSYIQRIEDAALPFDFEDIAAELKGWQTGTKKMKNEYREKLLSLFNEKNNKK